MNLDIKLLNHYSNRLTMDEVPTHLRLTYLRTFKKHLPCGKEGAIVLEELMNKRTVLVRNVLFEKIPCKNFKSKSR